jgi:asparagine synthase (glutamine-hydrolysing)
VCGIFGYVTTDPARGGRECLATAEWVLRHRGPDDHGAFESSAGEPRCGLAHTRLSIIDLSAAGHQPMATADGRHVISYNGEVYNFAEVRAELAGLGVRFRSACDTEVVLEACARWGPGALAKLRGMFAFALWDDRERTLLLARDRLGVKPLYYAEHPGGLAFASEVRALLATGFAERKLSPSGLSSYLAFGSVSDPDTLLDGVRSLPPGSFLVYRGGRATVTSYWAPPVERPREASFGEALERVGSVLAESVKLRLIADVPVGVFLSGGIDSSAIVALAARSAARPVHTFTVTFDEDRYSEESFAAEVATRFGCDHHPIRLQASRTAQEITGALAAADLPSADGINTYVVSKAVAEAGLRVALSGLGGDEVFAGYSNFRTFGRVLDLSRLAGALPAPLRDGLAGAIDREPAPNRARKIAGLLAARGDPGEVYATLRGMFSRGQQSALADPGFLVQAGPTAVARPDDLGRLLREGIVDPVNAFSLLELSNYLRNTLLRDTDAMSMAHSLEVRVPLLDHVLVEEVLRLPGSLKVRRGEKKPLLAKAVPEMPRSIVERRKMGFTLPLEAWFRGPLRGRIEEVLLGSGVGRTGALRPHGVEALWRSFLRGHRYVSSARVWCVAALVSWCDANGVTA